MARSSLFWVVCGVANPRHSWAHIGYVEQDSYEDYFSAAFDNVVNFIEGKPTRLINPESLKVAR